jgi:hypothetical protein
MDSETILLRILLAQRGWDRYGTFCREYERAAAKIDRGLTGTAPSRAQLHRWLSGTVRTLPYSDHCVVLEAMFAGRSAAELFRHEAVAEPSLPTGPGADSGPGPGQLALTEDLAPALIAPAGRYADVTAIFTSRAEFAAAFPAPVLFAHAKIIRMCGVCLSMLCQQHSDQQIRSLIKSGTTVRALFLDPGGQAIKDREREEGHPSGLLATLGELNIEVLTRIRDQLGAPASERLHIAVYDETVRFNLVFIDEVTCIAQPYLPYARGVDAPTLVIHRRPEPSGLYQTFDELFSKLWAAARAVLSAEYPSKRRDNCTARASANLIAVDRTVTAQYLMAYQHWATVGGQRRASQFQHD